jgi:ubiquinone/menaquinone biosynthesis C-methylase UbiE
VANPFKYSIGTRVRDNAFMSMLKPKAGDKILDVGCGLGYFTEMLNNARAECVGVDIDKRCISYCQDNLKGEYMMADINKLPFPDNSFDKVLCTEVLEHVNHNGVVLKEIRRVLKTNGTMVISVPCSEGVFGSLFKRIGHNNVDDNSREYHWHKGYTTEAIKHLLWHYQFEVFDIYYTLVLGVEIFMGLTKVVIRLLRAKKIDSQANALEVEKTMLWRVYCALFPVALLFARLEQPLARYFKGHMVIVKGMCVK